MGKWLTGIEVDGICNHLQENHFITGRAERLGGNIRGEKDLLLVHKVVIKNCKKKNSTKLGMYRLLRVLFPPLD